MKWQPIETAPRDGSKIIGWDPEGDSGMAIIFWWEHRYERYDEVEGGLFRRVHEVLPGYWEGGPHSPWRPTHWMPLPEPPK